MNHCNNSERQNHNKSISNEAFTLSVWNTGPKLYRTCLHLLKDGFNKSGLYNITPTPGFTKQFIVTRHFLVVAG